MKAILVVDVPTLDDGRHLCNECPIWNDKHLFCQYDFNMKAKGCPLKPMPIEQHEKGEVSEEVKEEHRKMMKEIDAVRCELHHIESDNKMLKEVIIRMAMEHTGVVG